MKTEFVLYAVKIGDQDWQEELITSTTNELHLNKARDWAKKNGFHKFRVAEYKGEAPDFSKTINN